MVYCFSSSTYTISDTAMLIGGITMGLESIGKNIRKFRHHRGLRQEDLAEITGLSINYIGAIERGEKIPALDTFIDILNALSVSADMVLSEVLQEGYQVKATKLSEQLKPLSAKDQKRIFDVIEVLIKHSG
jgi:transcriptional regulator with XRE-family HTH domain